MRISVLTALALAVPCAAAAASPDVPLPAAATQTMEQRLQELERQLRDSAAAVPSTAPIASAADAPTAGGPASQVSLTGYVETFYQWNFNEPDNGLTNYRGFDNRHHTITLQNAVLDVVGAVGPVTTHLALQFGHTPEMYYLAEPYSPGSAATGPSGPQVWKFLQQANVTWLAPVGRGLTVDAGLFLSPIGPEGMAVKDQWNWSRSNLFVGLPFYHAGARATYPLGEYSSLSLQLYNGWNSVSDRNDALAVAGQFTYSQPDKLTINLLYFGGIERDRQAPEGRPWRHLVDAYAAIHAKPWLSFLAEANGGYEATRLGDSGWAAAAGYIRIKPTPWVSLAARADLFREWRGSSAAGTAAPIFWAGANWVASQTLTLDVRPADRLSVRLELRRDAAEAPLFFKGAVPVPASGAPLANAADQATVTLGAVAWF